MTEQDIQELAPQFANYLRGFERYFKRDKTFDHYRDYCRGLLSDLERKSVEPIALAAGETVRTLQVFLLQGAWDHRAHRDGLQRRLGESLSEYVDDGLGTIGQLDETSAVKKGDKTPGVQRQYCGSVGKLENCIVTVHLGVSRGRFKTLIDADLFLPEKWDADRKRCRDAGIPDELHYRPKWEIGLEQLARAQRNGLFLDWLVFDEAYGKVPEFLGLLNAAGQKFVGEVPTIFWCRVGRSERPRRVDQLLASAAAQTQKWRRFRLKHETEAAQTWEAKEIAVRVRHCGPLPLRLIVARNVKTGEVKYVVSNAPRRVGLKRLLRVAFSRWKVEHCFRVIKSEVGLTHYEGRNYTGLMRHMIMCLTVMGFAALHTERLRGEKSGSDAGTGVPGSERPLLDPPRPPTENEPD
jgi:SRSO17 transposase